MQGTDAHPRPFDRAVARALAGESALPPKASDTANQTASVVLTLLPSDSAAYEYPYRDEYKEALQDSVTASLRPFLSSGSYLKAVKAARKTLPASPAMSMFSEASNDSHDEIESHAALLRILAALGVCGVTLAAVALATSKHN